MIALEYGSKTRKSRNCRSTPRKAQAPYSALLWLVLCKTNLRFETQRAKNHPHFLRETQFKPGSGAVHFHISHTAPASPSCPNVLFFFSLAMHFWFVPSNPGIKIFSARSFSGDPGVYKLGRLSGCDDDTRRYSSNYRCSKELGSFSDILG